MMSASGARISSSFASRATTSTISAGKLESAFRNGDPGGAMTKRTIEDMFGSPINDLISLFPNRLDVRVFEDFRIIGNHWRAHDNRGRNNDSVRWILMERLRQPYRASMVKACPPPDARSAISHALMQEM